jgi:anhydro-N-acetylmuramic acid kinase
VIADFRARDLAAGGEGAPLAPFFHRAAFASLDESRVVLNLGGIANITWLPRAAAAEDVIAFDVGPANAWLDAVVQLASDGAERFDRDGRRAARGRVDPALLAELLEDEFLRRPPPKSTGRERYGLAEAEVWSARSVRAGRPADDLLATLVEFGAEAVARACRDFRRACRATDRRRRRAQCEHDGGARAAHAGVSSTRWTRMACRRRRPRQWPSR